MAKKSAADRQVLFVSSVQKEMREERRAIKEYVTGDALLRRYFDVFLFEDLPASGRKPDDVYLKEVEDCDLYVGLFGREYGSNDSKGLSPTEREFEIATEKSKPRLIFIKESDDDARHPKEQELIRKASAQLIRRRFIGIPDLTAALYAALVEHLERRGDLRILPFDAASCIRAKFDDISAEKLQWFLETARRERGYALSGKEPVEKALAHLNLLDGQHLSHAAILLFGVSPQRFLPSSEVKCMHFHGVQVRKPIPSYQIFKGTVFDQVNQAVDFVVSRLVRTVGTRHKGVQVPVEYELPREAVAEAIVNSVSHRDYSSNATVQVMLFADRLEVTNPGELPAGLTPEKLRIMHPSIPRNPLIADPLFLAHYMEKAGTGTLDMIELCRKAGLPEPVFEQRSGQFVTTIWRSNLTPAFFAGLGLNERQQKAAEYVLSKGRITNREHQRITGTTSRTAFRDLEDLMQKGVLRKIGTTGRGAYYVLSGKRDRNRTNATTLPGIRGGAGKGQSKRPREAASTLGLRSSKQDINRTNRTSSSRRRGKGRRT